MTESGSPGPAFQAPSLDEWLAVIQRDLRGASFDRRLVRRGLDGLETRPLYTVQDIQDLPGSGWPGQPPWTRGPRPQGGWKAVQPVAHPDPGRARELALEELEGGADGVLIQADLAALGPRGVRLPALADLRALVKGLPLSGRILALEPGGHFLALSSALSLCGLPQDCVVHLGADPVGVLAATGELPGGSRSLGWLGDLAAWARRALPLARAACVDTRIYHWAGATEVDDLALALATGVTYLRAMSDAGLAIDQALDQVVFRLALDTEMLGAIAKIRALRRLWGRVAQACGAGEGAGACAVVHATPATRRLTRRDPWVNLLRNTVVTFAGACAGADLITTVAFDSLLGQPGDLGRRQARNTQLVLALESHLGRVADPAGGACFFEERTDQLARAAWARFQELEAVGGIVPALEEQLVQGWLDESRRARSALVARRKLPLTGVSEFPSLDERLPEGPPAERPPLPPVAPELALPSLPDPGSGELTAAMAGALAGAEAVVPLASFTELAEVQGSPIRGRALELERLAEPFERLRGRSDALLAQTGRRPTVFLATLGGLAEHTARTTFTRNLLAAGGLDVVQGPGGEDLERTLRAFQASACPAAVICGGDSSYERLAVATCELLSRGGGAQIWLAGRPGELAAPLARAGLTGALHRGCDVLLVLDRIWAELPEPSPPDQVAP